MHLYYKTKSTPDLSIVLPCFNEEEGIGYILPELVNQFNQSRFKVELVVCNNGSTDNTGDIISRLVSQGLPIIPVEVKVNQGYGFGITSAFSSCQAPWIGILPADGEVEAKDILRLFEELLRENKFAIAKVHRRFRREGVARSLVSVCYNILTHFLWPGIGTRDMNGNPKIIHKDILGVLNIQSKNWAIDPEIIIKSHQLGLEIVELNVVAKEREYGQSHVKPVALLEFLLTLIKFRFGSDISKWKISASTKIQHLGSPNSGNSTG